MEDPNKVIEHVKKLQDSGIHNVRIEFAKQMSEQEIANLSILKNFYKDNNTVKIKADTYRQSLSYNDSALNEKINKYSYIMDPSLNEYQILTMYINQEKGFEYITTEELLNILKGND